MRRLVDLYLRGRMFIVVIPVSVMGRLFFWLVLAGFLLVTACQTPPPDSPTTYPNLDLLERPNIVWLVAEDLSPLLPMYGDSTVETPNLSRLAGEGVTYTNVYSVSGVCAPSRYTLATGRYTTSDGAHNMRVQYSKAHLEQVGLTTYEVVPPPAVKMMSHVLREAGYYTSNNDKEDHQFAPPQMAWDAKGRQATWRGRADGQPFFSIFNFGITHESQVWNARTPRGNQRFYELFNRQGNEDVVQQEGHPNHVPDDLAVSIPPYLPDTEAVRNDVQRVYSNIIEMDRHIGEVLAALEADGLLENAIIVFYADHGGPLPRQKRLLYDSGLRVPMIIRYPNAQHAGTVDDQLVSFVDFAPTTFSLAGIEPPAYLEGQAVLGPYREAPRSYIYAAADRLDSEYDMIRAVRDKRFKYLRNFKPDKGYYLPVAYREQMATMQELLRLRDAEELTDVQRQWFRASKPEEELFDTENDPHELDNLALGPAYAGKLAELRGALDAWMVQTNDKGFTAEHDLLEQFWPNRQQPETAPPTIQRSADQITLASVTKGAVIGYQIGENAEDSWQIYTGPFMLIPNQPLRAMAHRLGYQPSVIIEVP